MSNFWQQLPKPFFVLAPMANVTDWAFRKIVAKCGRPDVFYTEFLSCDGIVYDKKRFEKELYFERSEKPIIVQFFGSKPKNFYKCARLAVKLGFDGIDINMGCPDRSVMKQGGGAALILKPELAKEIIKTTKEGAGELPVSIKTRLGYDKIITEDWASHLIEAEPAAIIVHGRTAKEMSKVPAHWDEIGKAAELCRKAGIPIVGNGDVATYSEGIAKAKQYGLDGIMVGRGIFTNPWFFRALRSLGEGGNKDTEHAERTPNERIDLLREHLNNFEELWGESKSFDVIKKFFKVYISNWPGAKELRIELMAAKNKKDIVDILSGAP